MKIVFEEKKCALCDNDSKFIELVVCKDLRINQDVRAVICPNCGLVFLNPGPTEKSYLDYYASIMGQEDAPPSRNDIIDKKRVIGPLFVNFLKNNICDMSTKDVVDVGSGWGGFLYYLKPDVKSLVSTEVFGPAIRYIEKEFDCRVYNVHRLKEAFLKNSFDLITSTAVIEHYPDPISAILDYYYVLKDGGYLFLYTHDIKGMCFDFEISQYFKFVHPYYYSVKSLKSLLRKTGFKTVSCWSSKPAYSTRSIRYPNQIEPGAMMVLAKKDGLSHPEPMISKDDPNEIISIFNKAKEKKLRFQIARRLWLSHLSIPFRLLCRMIPYNEPDKYAPVREQYEAEFGFTDKRQKNDLSQILERYLLTFYSFLAKVFMVFSWG